MVVFCLEYAAVVITKALKTLEPYLSVDRKIEVGS